MPLAIAGHFFPRNSHMWFFFLLQSLAHGTLLVSSTCFKFFLCQWNLIVIKHMWCVYIVHSLHICFVVTRMTCVNRIIYRCVFSFAFQLKVLLCFSATAELGSEMGSFHFSNAVRYMDLITCKEQRILWWIS